MEISWRAYPTALWSFTINWDAWELAASVSLSTTLLSRPYFLNPSVMLCTDGNPNMLHFFMYFGSRSKGWRIKARGTNCLDCCPLTSIIKLVSASPFSFILKYSSSISKVSGKTEMSPSSFSHLRNPSTLPCVGTHTAVNRCAEAQAIRGRARRPLSPFPGSHNPSHSGLINCMSYRWWLPAT